MQENIFGSFPASPMSYHKLIQILPRYTESLPDMAKYEPWVFSNFS